MRNASGIIGGCLVLATACSGASADTQDLLTLSGFHFTDVDTVSIVASQEAAPDYWIILWGPNDYDLALEAWTPDLTTLAQRYNIGFVRVPNSKHAISVSAFPSNLASNLKGLHDVPIYLFGYSGGAQRVADLACRDPKGVAEFIEEAIGGQRTLSNPNGPKPKEEADYD